MTEDALINRVFSHLANGVLIYAIFYGVIWLLVLKGGLAAQMEVVPTGGDLPPLVATMMLPFLVSTISAFLAHAALRLTLKRMRLRLSGDESTASRVFIAVLTLLALTGSIGRLFDMAEGPLAYGQWLTPLAVVLGAWAGVAIRRRIAI